MVEDRGSCKEMEEDVEGRRWKEMEGDGRRWREIDGV
jgi:hypothetical protein